VRIALVALDVEEAFGAGPPDRLTTTMGWFIKLVLGHHAWDEARHLVGHPPVRPDTNSTGLPGSQAVAALAIATPPPFTARRRTHVVAADFIVLLQMSGGESPGREAGLRLNRAQ